MNNELDYYAQQSKNIHRRFGISEHVQFLLRTIDDVRKHYADEDELRRMIRHSRNHRKAIIETIDQVATLISVRPKEVKDGAALICTLTKILKAGDDTPSMLSFMKLPREVRNLIYRQYLTTPPNRFSVSRDEKTCYPVSKSTDCFCSFEGISSHPGAKKVWTSETMGLALVSKTVRDELMCVAMSERQFYFSCTCEMAHQLRTNALMLRNIQSIRFHWCGPKSVEAFKLLKRCRRLRKLIVMPSVSTTRHLTQRQQFFSRFFTQHNRIRLSDAQGIDELVEIRGLSGVEAMHIPVRQGLRRSNEELANLNALLRGNLLQEKPSNYGDDDVEGAE